MIHHSHYHCDIRITALVHRASSNIQKYSFVVLHTHFYGSFRRLVKPKHCEKQTHFKVFHSLQGTTFLLVSPEKADLSPLRYAQIAKSAVPSGIHFVFYSFVWKWHIPCRLRPVSELVDICFRQCSSQDRQNVFTHLHIHSNKVIHPKLNAV